MSDAVKVKVTQELTFYAPKRRSATYWFYLITFMFFIPFALITTGLTILLYALVPKLFFLGPVIGFWLGLRIARKSHRKMLKMSDVEYVQMFNPAAQVNTCEAPRRGSKAYWVQTIIFRFFLPWIFISVPLTVVIGGLATKLFWLGPLIAAICAFWIMRKRHRKIMAMDEEEYATRFKSTNIVPQQEDWRTDTGCPYDPASSAYWTLGPGSYRN